MSTWNDVPYLSKHGMTKKTATAQRREDSLSRERIIEASIELLDSDGESGLTFRALSERLATGPGAIYWHVANKGELLAAACDAIVARAIDVHLVEATPEVTIRTLALSMFDAIDTHPWVGSALTRALGQLPVVRILERIGQQVQILDVPVEEQWATTSAILNYIFGAGGQNADNVQSAQTRGIDRSQFLKIVSAAWKQLDPDEYPFARSIAEKLRGHDDRADFLKGIDLILAGIGSAR